MSESKTIGVDVRALVGPPSGIGFYTLSLLDRLARRGEAKYLAMAHAEIHGEDELAAAGVAFDYQHALSGVVWQQLAVRRRIRARDVDLFWSPLLTLPLGLDRPTVVTVHDLTPVLHPETHSLKVRLSILPFLSRTIRQANRIVADSRSTADDIAHRYPASVAKLSVVYPGVDAEFRPGTETEIAKTRTEMGFPEGYILFVGTLEPRKNLRMLLDAWEALCDGNPRSPGLVVAGGYGWRSRRLLGRIRRLERTARLVYLDRIPRAQLVRVYQAATTFVLPSIYEGFGLPAAEAMACGVPTVVTNTSSLPEVVGSSGVIVELDEVEALARTLRELSADRSWAKELGEMGRERAATFDWGKAAAEMEQVFAEALR